MFRSVLEPIRTYPPLGFCNQFPLGSKYVCVISFFVLCMMACDLAGINRDVRSLIGVLKERRHAT